jgi:transcriptional regulator with GAF, ATPase, and Fis domain
MLGRPTTTRVTGTGARPWTGPDSSPPRSGTAHRLADFPAADARLTHILADCSARLGAADFQSVDDAVRASLAQVGTALALDRAVIWPDVANFEGAPTYDWTRTPMPPPETLALGCASLLTTALGDKAAACFVSVDEVVDGGARDLLRRAGVRSATVIPIVGSTGRRGAAAFMSTTAEREWPAAALDPLRAYTGIVGQALARQALERIVHDLQHLREGRDDSRPASTLRGSHMLVAESPAIQQALAQAEQVAPSNATVLLLGETGVGKEVFAQTIHRLSPRHQKTMVSVSCGAIPSALIESELFGRERGAYTGALTRQIGRFEAASQSTLFLDEVGELSGEVQIKLLRVLQERTIERLGSTHPIKVDVRIIAATNRNLEKAVDDKAFREDLFYRLNVFPISVPPLRERMEDLPGLVWEFVDEFSKALGKSIESISEESMRELRQYSWPGNVRELRNVVERAVIIASGPRLAIPIPQRGSRPPMAPQTLRNLETEHIRATLEATQWRIRGAGGAAERLGLKPTTLEGRMAKLGLVRPRRP